MPRTNPTDNDLAKTAVARRILANPVYMPESGVVRRLLSSLVYGRPSLSNLQSLELIIDLKIKEKQNDV